MSSYEKEYLWAKNEPESFWRAQAENLDWFESPKTILKSDEKRHRTLVSRWCNEYVLVSIRLPLRARTR